MRSESYLTILLTVLHALADSNSRLVHQDDFRKMAGIYYEVIEKELLDNEVIFTKYPRPLRSSHDSRLFRYIERIELELENLKQKNFDRQLSNQEKMEGLDNSRKSLDIAEKSFKWTRRGIIFTAIVALGQIIQWIIMIIQLLTKSKS